MPMCLETDSQGIQLVYEHWRPDRGICFYVGKGKGKRAHSFRRNSRYDRIVAKLDRLGLQPEVRIIHRVATAEEASALEIERIAFWRATGADLANYTDGGDGSPGHIHSVETRKIIAAKARGRIASAETRIKMGLARKGGKRNAETRAKMSASASVAQKLRFERMKRTRKGRINLRLQMIRISRKNRDTTGYREQKRQAALMGWAKRRALEGAQT